MHFRTFLWVALVLAAIPSSLASQAASPQPSIWIAYDGKDRFRLSEAERIPTGRLVSLRGYPAGVILPRVWVRDANSGERLPLPVSRESTPKGEAWTAPVPTLGPNGTGEIVVQRFEPADSADLAAVSQEFRRLALTVSEALVTGEIPEGAASTVSSRIVRLLRREISAASPLQRLVVVTDGSGDAEPQSVAERITELFAGVNTELRNLAPDYVSSLRLLDELVRPFLEKGDTNAIPASDRRRIAEAWNAIPQGVFAASLAQAYVWAGEVLLGSTPVVPFPRDLAASVRRLVAATADLNEGQRERYLEKLEVVATPVEERAPELFTNLMVVVEGSYRVSSVAGPLQFEDLARYGTVDFMSGIVTDNDEALSFVTLSLAPGRPQSRTPYGPEDRVALTLGVSVTRGSTDDGVGDDAGDTEDSERGRLFLAGLTIRLNRYFSATMGMVLRGGGSEKRCCFVGLGGDVSGLPFLNDLFTVKPE